MIFDCDAPEKINEVIRLMLDSTNEYILDLSNLLFETWLVMHFEKLEYDIIYKKRVILSKMEYYLGLNKGGYTSKVKASIGTIGKILGSDGNTRIQNAIENAKELEQHWKEIGFDYRYEITTMNPYVKCYDLVERILDEITYRCK